MDGANRPVDGVEVDRLARREVPRAARLLARAFAADPVIGYYLSGWRRRFAFPAFFRLALFEAVPYHTVFAARSDGKLAGVAAWVPPEAAEISGGVRAQASKLALRALFPVMAGKLLAGFGGLSALHPEESHWYLAFVGVEPALQERGVGARLLAPVLQRADAEGSLCYLETPFRETHRFYERLGFAVTSESTPFEVPTAVWTMVRPAPTRR
jgi:GNAT superfamily N-acetyltransferase